MKTPAKVYIGIASLALMSTGCGIPVGSTSIPIRSNSFSNSTSGTGSYTPTPLPISVPTATPTLPPVTCIPGANIVSPSNGVGAGCYQVQRSSSDPNLISISAITPVSGTVCVIPVVMLSGIPVPISESYESGTMQSGSACVQITTTPIQLQFTSYYYRGATQVPLDALIIVAQGNFSSLNYDLTNNSPSTHALPTMTTFSFGTVN